MAEPERPGKIEPMPVPSPVRPDRHRLESLVSALFPIGQRIDLHPRLALRPAHLRRLERSDGQRFDAPAFVVERVHPLDYFETSPAASFWEIDVTPLSAGNGTVAPDDLAGCARTHRQATVRLTGQLLAPVPGEDWDEAARAAALAALLEARPD